MRFRFTISRDVGTPESIPDLTAWLSDPLGNLSAVVPWSNVGTSTPDVSLNNQASEYLYTDYVFQKGWTYRIDIALTMADNTMFPSNPRTLGVVVKDEDNSTVFSQGIVVSTGSSVYSYIFTATADCRKFGFLFSSGSDRDITVDAVDMEVTDFGLITAQISEPDGWKGGTLKLARDPVFHSVVEYFEGSFIFYGDNGRVNGGYHILKQWEEDGGPDVDIDILIEYSDNDVNYYEAFRGQLDISESEWMPDHKVRVPIIKDSFWATFMNRKDTPVSLTATEDLDDNIVLNPVDDITLELPSQKIRYNGEYRWRDSFSYERGPAGDTSYIIQLDWDETIVDDLKKFNIPRASIVEIDPDDPPIVGLFEAPWDGDYTFDVRIVAAYYSPDDNLWRFVTSSNAVVFTLHLVGETAQRGVNGFHNDADSYAPDSISVHTFNKTLRLLKGQQIAVYGQFSTGVPPSFNDDSMTIFGERRLSWVNVRLATNGTISLSGEQTIDGETTSSDRVLVKNQGDPSLNGIYVSASGAWTRATDADTAADLYDRAVYVTDGDSNEGTGWRQAETEIDLGTSPITWLYQEPTDERFRPYPGPPVVSYFKVTADTTFRDTVAPAFLLHDAAAAILAKYGLNWSSPFYSESFGSDRTLARQYDNDGCYWAYSVVRGLQLRGYSLFEKSFSMSFMEWWRGADPIFCLGLGYEHILPDVINPGDTEVAAMEDWENASGTHPGTWSYTGPDVPHVSVNGNNGVSGYTKGACITVANQPYQFTFELEIFDTGSSGEFTTVTVAILDAGDNEIATKELYYDVAGVKTETFSLTPDENGVSVALRITNNTPFDTKNYQLNSFTDESTPIVIQEEKRIRVEKRSHFYNPNPVVSLHNIRNTTRRYDTEKIYKKILIGYQQWKTEDISGIDDPQTKHTYATRLKKTGEEIEVLSEFIGASLAIEQARRQSIDKTTDYQFDDTTFIIAVNPESQGGSPDIFYPETDERFTVINNLLNSETRYNIRITPARNFLRHLKWFNVGLQSYLGTLYKFVRGEGNYDVETAMLLSCEEEDYGGNLLGEGQSFTVTDETLFSVYFYEIEHPLSLSAYRDIASNPNNAIGISQSESGHVPFFINDFSYQVAKGKVTFSGWTTERLDIVNIMGPAPEQTCLTSPEPSPLVTECVLYDDNTEVFYDDDTCVQYEL